ncbi:MAG: Fic family protein [Candidatus Aminicenantes bacterium]|nr:Fic family protein [Candidatus Aminicenantes bacterium]
MKPIFKHFDLRIVYPNFNSDLTDIILELDYLRKKPLGGSTPAEIFFQLKHIFHLLESIGSARIEGNRTTIAEFIENIISPVKQKEEGIKEIENTDRAMHFIDENIEESSIISRAFIQELHKITVQQLKKEGDRTPGNYRKGKVEISGSTHLPPEAIQVREYIDELVSFINKNTAPKYDLLKTAIAHHRFAWIHPFNNGNGRVVRLLTYSMLIKQGFNVQAGRILNPTAIFCIDRNKYYKMLSQADKGTDSGILTWCEYVMSGLNREIQNIDKLTNQSYLNKNILFPTINYCLTRKMITSFDAAVMNLAVKKEYLKSSDLLELLPGESPLNRSRIIAKLRKDKFLVRSFGKKQKYVINFSNNCLLRGIIEFLGKEKFIPLSE